MKRLYSKPCPYCGQPIFGRKRTDRNSYHYAPRCPDCARKSLDDSVLEKKRRVLNEIRKVKPIGSRRKHKTHYGRYYWQIKIAHPNVWEYEHRVIAKAKPSEHVHHINNDSLDNRPENLKIVTASTHAAEHKLLTWSKQFDCCQKCGTTSKRHTAKGLCTTCYQQQ